jgi:4-hydroxy-4-methyl-2-oxoglutarate aldolase
MKRILTTEQLKALQHFDTCSLSNAIDTFEVRLRNEGYTNSSIHCITPQLPPMAGHAVTLKIRCSSPRTAAHTYLDRTDWWDHILTFPEPRVVAIEDLDNPPGAGAFVGEVHSNILRALGCAGAITNGAVRDIPAVEKIPFHLFAGSVAVSHAYAHIVEIGGDVRIGGLKIKSGDLLHADRHGVLSVPAKIAPKLPSVVLTLAEEERKLIALCRSGDFTLEQLKAAVKK